MRLLPLAALLLACCALAAAQPPALDSDHDGLSDADEAALLARFAPRFFLSRDDCSLRPARFVPLRLTPTVAADDGTLYGQATPRPSHRVELHYYDLWRTDCGQIGHPLDAEHVSVLVLNDPSAPPRALYWYAAAHEDTVCDASQIARASTLGAALSGPAVWISRGKHAAFFAPALCDRGCGGDACPAMTPLTAPAIVNLGEPGAPMNGASWVDAPQWPLGVKMRRTDFPAERTRRLDGLPATDIAWANPGKRPVQAAILGGDSALGGAATGLRATDTAFVLADAGASGALQRSSTGAGSALARAWRGTKKALGAAARKTLGGGEPPAPSAVPSKP